MINVIFPGSCQLRNAYVSVLSAAGSSAINGASRWLAACDSGGVVARIMRAATDNATACFKQFIFEFVMVDVPFLAAGAGADSPRLFFYFMSHQRLAKRSGNCLTMAAARGSAIIPMCPAALRIAMKLLFMSPL